MDLRKSSLSLAEKLLEDGPMLLTISISAPPSSLTTFSVTTIKFVSQWFLCEDLYLDAYSFSIFQNFRFRSFSLILYFKCPMLKETRAPENQEWNVVYGSWIASTLIHFRQEDVVDFYRAYCADFPWEAKLYGNYGFLGYGKDLSGRYGNLH
ncbi:hypothetical protein L2E82_47658 [Cichorium intybus]|uniref:Uncharacterized protein n=1 Tax=Cichorium intybus TaxID=13427 RepID=A0ACB8YWM3_CICIN|nr:hypothetical protein L2E82_47658 [Cichorium intybus]